MSQSNTNEINNENLPTFTPLRQYLHPTEPSSTPSKSSPITSSSRVASPQLTTPVHSSSNKNMSANTTVGGNDLESQFGPGGFNSTKSYPSRHVKSPRPSNPSSRSVSPAPYPNDLRPNSPNLGLGRTSSLANQGGSESPSLKQRAVSGSPLTLNLPTGSGALMSPGMGGSPLATPFPISDNHHHNNESILLGGGGGSGSTSSPRIFNMISLRALGITKSLTRLLTLGTLFLLFLYMIFAHSHSHTVGPGQVLLHPGGNISDDKAESMYHGLGADGKVVVKGKIGAPKVLNYHKPEKVPAMAPPRTHQRPATSILTPARQLLALQSYLLASPHHTLASSVSSSTTAPPGQEGHVKEEPVDLELLLDFKADDEAGWVELERTVDPVVIWTIGKTWNEPIQTLLEIYSLHPAPTILPLQKRVDLHTIQTTLARLVPGRPINARDLPLITIGGKPVATYHDLMRLHNSGELHQMLEDAGAEVDGMKVIKEEEERRKMKGRPLKQAAGNYKRQEGKQGRRMY